MAFADGLECPVVPGRLSQQPAALEYDWESWSNTVAWYDPIPV